MFEIPLQEAKQRFIDHLLSQYTFKSRISVWLLNYLKATPQLLDMIYFVDQTVEHHPTLEIATVESGASGVVYYRDEEHLINMDTIFYRIIQTTDRVDIKIHLNDNGNRDHLLDHILLYQLLDTQGHPEYLSDLYYVTLSKTTEQQLLKLLTAQIDMSLTTYDAASFYHLTRLRNTLKLRQ
ncbi:YpiB family protein [Staphylococcus sp. 17KM0847]|uniref:YpiB family protein n=1 Tax=Staphylococcus sp. 17KM0847 TaxID=2583989 RepID=UPI002155BBE8|nr:YpiB family protein [Staphylococcus sp. 17KM0847]